MSTGAFDAIKFVVVFVSSIHQAQASSGAFDFQFILFVSAGLRIRCTGAIRALFVVVYFHGRRSTAAAAIRSRAILNARQIDVRIYRTC